MEILIEIGNHKQRQKIREELFLFHELLQKIDFAVKIHKLIVASDFDKTVNEIQKTTNYKSNRGLNSSSVTAMAKILDVDDGCIIVISPLLFSEENDSQTRYYIYFHELIHAINKQKIPTITSNSLTKNTYESNIYCLYDEYYSDRFSYYLTEKCFQSPSGLWQNFITNEFNGFTSLINDLNYYENLKKEILNFRLYKLNVEEFLNNIKPIFDTVSITITHTYALIDQYQELFNIDKLKKSKFINKNTTELMNYYKRKYVQNSFDLTDGMQLILDFMTNFGIKFNDTEHGLYCRILDV